MVAPGLCIYSRVYGSEVFPASETTSTQPSFLNVARQHGHTRQPPSQHRHNRQPPNIRQPIPILPPPLRCHPKNNPPPLHPRRHRIRRNHLSPHQLRPPPRTQHLRSPLLHLGYPRNPAPKEENHHRQRPPLQSRHQPPQRTPTCNLKMTTACYGSMRYALTRSITVRKSARWD